MTKYIISSLLTFALFLLISTSTLAVSNPTSVSNNRFGIHIIQATVDESSPAAQLVNSSGGDWGYLTVLIERKDKKLDKWQAFFDDLRRRHLIPIVRLATEPDSGNWKRPDENEEEAWADFLNSLNWPTKNRYVVVYNEPNHGQEWGGATDPRSYARVLDKTITALKKRSEDFFVLNAGLDQITPHRPPNYFDELSYLVEMDQEVPGIFNKLDGWSSHSYPNPGFVGSPQGVGRATVRGFYWELQQLRSLGLTKNLPVFITETGWKHSEGVNFDPVLPSTNTLANYYRDAFTVAWNAPQIVAITPFLLSYQDVPFDHFSFKRLDGDKEDRDVASETHPRFYEHYQEVVELPKIAGKPLQINKAELTQGEIYSAIVSGESYSIPLTFKNNGQSIWGDQNNVELRLISTELGEHKVSLGNQLIEPGKSVTFSLPLKAPKSGTFKVKLQLYRDNIQFDNSAWEFTTEVKSPVSLVIKSKLNWKSSSQGEYILTITSPSGETLQYVTLTDNGESEPIEARYLLPDYTFNFTLSKPFYHPKTIQMQVVSGINTLDFEALQPNILSALFNPKEFWNLLPFSTQSTTACKTDPTTVSC